MRHPIANAHCDPSYVFSEMGQDERLLILAIRDERTNLGT